MTKYEFIQTLRSVLSNAMNHNLVNDNVKYYEDYIDMEMRKGRSEEEVLHELGDPRLIAKTIIDTNKASADSKIDDRREEENGENVRNSAYKIPGWLVILIVIAVIVLIFGVVTSLISFILPILLPLFIITFVIKLFTSKRN